VEVEMRLICLPYTGRFINDVSARHRTAPAVTAFAQIPCGKKMLLRSVMGGRVEGVHGE